MRIIIDLQGAQSSGSRNRGIGRYSLSLAQAIARNIGNHELLIALNGGFSDTLEPIREAFDGLVKQSAIYVWYPPKNIFYADSRNSNRRRSAELIREAFLAALRPDIVIVTSLFEGLDDDVATSVGVLSQTLPTAIILYDLIPLIRRDPYLANPIIESWFENKLGHMRRANLLFAISESSRQEGIEYLGFPAENSINISTAADPHFKPLFISKSREDELRLKYGLDRQFMMYTGGIDYRKNIEGLIRAYSRLPKSLRATHQLAVVCSVKTASRTALQKLAKEQGLKHDELILTGFVPDLDLVHLYNLCKAFVFPSIHEGFGLPALEAMSCGKAVIGSNNSSLPEVIGNDNALFDPNNDESITEKIAQVLSDPTFRKQLEQHGHSQSKKFTWDDCAKKTLAAIENWSEREHKNTNYSIRNKKRPKLAYISPIPPERSGISDYSAELLPELARHYDIDVIVNQEKVVSQPILANCNLRDVKWFRTNANSYDRVLYHFGNNHLHQHMFGLLKEIPGIVVLHDFFLSGIIRHMDLTGYAPNLWNTSIYRDHGYVALAARHTGDGYHVIWDYPNNLSVINNSLGVIVHSESSRRLTSKWYGERLAEDLDVIPLLRSKAKNIDRNLARLELNIPQDAFVTCSFGFLSPTKLNKRLLDAWLSSDLFRNKKCYLFFVGQNNGEAYGADLLQTINSSAARSRIYITGWTDTEIFHKYLAATDIAVQLRTLSRGETSAAVLDCMNYGIPTIINAHGSLSDLPPKSVWMMPDEFSNDQLSEALDTLLVDSARRNDLRVQALQTINLFHLPRDCANHYAMVIENKYLKNSSNIHALANAIGCIDLEMEATERYKITEAVVRSITEPVVVRQLFLDVTALQRDGNYSISYKTQTNILRDLLLHPPKNFRIEPVHLGDDNEFYYSRKFTLNFLSCSIDDFEDDVIDVNNGDIFIGLHSSGNELHSAEKTLQQMRYKGVTVHFIIDGNFQINDLEDSGNNWPPSWIGWVAKYDGVVCKTSKLAHEFANILPAVRTNRRLPFHIGTIYPEQSLIVEADPQAAHWSVETQGLIDFSIYKKLITKWNADGTIRYFGSDSDLKTQVGKKAGGKLETTGVAGCLLFGPYAKLEPGKYTISAYGQVSTTGSRAYIDASAHCGAAILGSQNFTNTSGAGIISSFDINIESIVADLEIRIFVADDTIMQLAGLSIELKLLENDGNTFANNSSWLEYLYTTRKTKIGWITSWNTKCGIAGYSSHLINQMSGDITIFAPHTANVIDANNDKCIRSWQAGKENNCLESVSALIKEKEINVIIIQFNYGFFSFLELSKFVDQEISRGHKIIFMLHSTVNPYGETANWDISELRESFSRSHALLVHSQPDLQRLSAIGLESNVQIFPHGVLHYDNLAVRNEVGNTSVPLIAAYGFCLPHKGLTELVEAVGRLVNQGTEVNLRLVNAEYPVSVSKDLINNLHSLVDNLRLSTHVDFHNDFLEDEDSLKLLADATLLVFPYQNTGESSSAAARYGLATKRPVAVTPLAIFDDLGSSVFKLPGTSSLEISEGIKNILFELQSESIHAREIEKNADAWRSSHDYKAVGARLQQLCDSLVN